MKRTFALALVLAAYLATTAVAAEPPFLSYQGILTDESGKPVPDDTYSITFNIYNVGAGGTPLWTETDYVAVSRGTFSVLLGATAALSVLPFNEAYYIGMSIGGGPELPRQRLTFTPYSFSAKAVSGTDNVFPSMGNVGVGTMSPTVPLHVTSISGQVGIRFDGNDDDWSSIYVNAIKPSASAGFGYMLGSTLRAYTFVDQGSNWNLRLGADTYALRASQSGNVCIGPDVPSNQRLKVDGGLELGNTVSATAGTIRWSGSDFEGYDGSTWQSFTSTGAGLPAGSFGQTLRHSGTDWTATSNLYNDGTNVGIGTTTPEANLHVTGDVRIGSSGSNGSLNLLRAGIPTALVSASGNSYGGYVETYDEEHNLICAFRPNWNGAGGVLGVTRSTDMWGLYVDGNVNGTGQPSVAIVGDDRDAFFDMSQPGDVSVMLPLESISSAEEGNEPGVASYANQSGVSLTASISTIASQSITIPEAGYVLVIASGNLMVSHTNGTASHAIIGTSDDAYSFPDNQDMYVDYPGTAATGTYYIPATWHGLYYHPYSGTYTYYLLGIRTNGAYTCYENQLSLIYLPTAYGTVQPTLTTPRSTGGKTTGFPLMVADVAAQRTACEAANTARIRKEMDAMKVRLSKLESEMRQK